LGTASGNGPKEKPPGKRQSAAILLRALAVAWPEVAKYLLPRARPAIARLVREVHAYTEAERVDAKALHRWRTQRRAKAARTEAAVLRLFEDLRILRSWTELAEVEFKSEVEFEVEFKAEVKAGVKADVEVDVEAKTAVAFRNDAARFEAQHRPYLTRLKGRAAWVARHREHSGSGYNYVREVVFDRLTSIAKTYRRDPNAPLITQDRGRDDPYGLVVYLAWDLRDCLLCLPRSAIAIHRAYFRAMAARQRRRKRQVIAVPQE
jgi:hypothetical protein